MSEEIKLIAKYKETLVEKEKELEKFRKWQQDTAQSLYDKDKEIEKLNNIINEVREEIEKLANLYDDNYTITDKAKDILEILD